MLVPGPEPRNECSDDEFIVSREERKVKAAAADARIGESDD